MQHTPYTEHFIKNQLDNTYIELLIRSYSEKTIKAYTLSLKEFFKFTSSHLLQNIDFLGESQNFDENLIRQFLKYKKEQNCSAKTLHVYLCAIKFFYREVLKISFKITIKFAKRPRKLPTILTHHEIMEIICTLQNLKHKLIIALAYGAGLRVSEITNLKTKHLNFEERKIFIQQSKGAKDRITILPEPILNDLQEFTAKADKDDYVFTSQRGGKLSTRTLQKTFKKALQKSNLSKDASFHSLRHSFASRLVNSNVNLRIIQELLGHKSIKTTQIYTQIEPEIFRNIQSPLQNP